MSNNTIHNKSIRALIQMAIALVAVVAVCLWQQQFLVDLYVVNQVGPIGWFINGAILALFGSGVVRLAALLFYYYRQEQALEIFVSNQRKMVDPPTRKINTGTIIVQRYKIMSDMHERHAPINHSALASTLVAEETSRTTLLKFVNNVLILTGVFGTIVSLSIALLGASSMITSTTEISGLGTVIRGMSTALSTTVTAIVAFLFFGFFYLRLQDIQTHLISDTEFVTATMLVPRFQRSADSIMGDYSEMLQSANDLIHRLGVALGSLQSTQEKLSALVETAHDEMPRTRGALEQIIELLRSGFRLADGGAIPGTRPGADADRKD